MLPLITANDESDNDVSYHDSIIIIQFYLNSCVCGNIPRRMSIFIAVIGVFSVLASVLVHAVDGVTTPIPPHSNYRPMSSNGRVSSYHQTEVIY